MTIYSSNNLLLSPFQERKLKTIEMTNSPSYISLSDSASSSSSFSDVNQSPSEGSIELNDGQITCFCGQAILKDEDDEMGIYCSSRCARQDAMAALIGDLAPSTPERSKIRSVPNLPGHISSQKSKIKSTTVNKAYQSSIILQQKTMNSTHYRRMEAMETRDEYPIEAIEEAFLTPSSGSTSLYDACEERRDDRAGGIMSDVQPSFTLQRWMKENGLQVKAEKMQMDTLNDTARQSSEIDISYSFQNTQKRMISLPSSPSLDSDDEETQDQRKRQAEIEQEIKELDVELKQKLEQFDKDQADISLRDSSKPSDSFEEDDVLMEFTSPKLDYEAPLGWRRGTKVYSTNFLGLQLSSDEEDLSSILSSSHGSNEALDHSSYPSSRLQRLHEALGMTTVDEDIQDERSNEKKKQIPSPQLGQNSRIPSALDMAKELAFIQATCNARQHVRQLSTTSIGEMPQRKTKMKNLSNQPATLSNKRSLTSFFQRRPSQNTLETGISNVSVNTNRLTKSSSPRFATLKPASSKRAF